MYGLISSDNNNTKREREREKYESSNYTHLDLDIEALLEYFEKIRTPSFGNVANPGGNSRTINNHKETFFRASSRDNATTAFKANINTQQKLKTISYIKKALPQGERAVFFSFFPVREQSGQLKTLFRLIVFSNW